MLALFRNNQSTTTLLLAIYIGLLHLPALLGWAHPAADNSSSDAGLMYEWMFGWARQSEFYSALATAGFIFIQAILVNSLADEFRIAEDRDWLPGAMYALAASSLVDYWFLSPPVVAATFIPLALRRMFRVYKKAGATALIFDVGFWLAVASLFYPSAIWILLVLFAGINSLRSFNMREYLVCLSGFFTPIFLAWTTCFWMDCTGEFLTKQFGQLFDPVHLSLDIDMGTWIKIGVLGFLLLVMLLSFGIYYRKKLIQVQKYITVHYWLLLVVALTVLLRTQLRAEHFFLAMSSVGIFLAMSVAAIRRPWLAEALHLAAIAGIFLVQFLPSFNLNFLQIF